MIGENGTMAMGCLSEECALQPESGWLTQYQIPVATSAINNTKQLLMRYIAKERERLVPLHLSLVLWCVSFCPRIVAKQRLP